MVIFPSQKMSVMQGACAFTGKGSHVVGMDRPDPHYCCYKGNIIVALSQSKATPPPKKPTTNKQKNRTHTRGSVALPRETTSESRLANFLFVFFLFLWAQSQNFMLEPHVNNHRKRVNKSCLSRKVCFVTL